MWQQGIDVAPRDAAGLTPIEPFLAEIDAIADLRRLPRSFCKARMFRRPVAARFPLASRPDLRDSGINAVYLGGPWLGLPNRDYYLEEGNEAVRDAYIETNAKLLERLGPRSRSRAGRRPGRLRFRSRARRDHPDPRGGAEPGALLQPADRRRARASATRTWTGGPTSRSSDIADTDRIIVTQIDYLDHARRHPRADADRDPARLPARAALLELLQQPRSGAGRNRFHLPPVARRAAGHASARGAGAEPDERTHGRCSRQALRRRALPARGESRRWKLWWTRIIAAFGERLERNEWMTPETREKALGQAGHAPGQGRLSRTSGKRTKRSRSASPTPRSVLSAANASLRESLAEAGLPVDRDEWGMNAQTANAYYSPLNNEIVFPAAILQPPFFDYRADPASNYGAIGFIIGHEITHGFDLQGSRFDENGNLDEWWTAEDRARFEALNQDLVAQYDAIEVLPDLFVNGQITVTENVADLGGVETAYDALQSLLAEEGEGGDFGRGRRHRSPPTAWTSSRPSNASSSPPRPSGEARFRDEALITRVRSGVHAPPDVRATQPLRNTDEFYEAFGIVEGDPMYLAPSERVRIW